MMARVPIHLPTGYTGRGWFKNPRRAGEMNKTEMALYEVLSLQKAAGELVWVEYERVTLKLGPDCRYTPDFDVLTSAGTLMFYDAKGGFIAEDATVKIKTAAELFPFFSFYIAQLTRNGWEFKEV